MHGSSVGPLRVYLIGGEVRNFTAPDWETSGGQGDRWKMAQIPIPNDLLQNHENFSVRFVYFLIFFILIFVPDPKYIDCTHTLSAQRRLTKQTQKVLLGLGSQDYRHNCPLTHNTSSSTTSRVGHENRKLRIRSPTLA